MPSRSRDDELSKAPCRDALHVATKHLEQIANDRYVEIDGGCLDATVLSHPLAELDHNRRVRSDLHVGRWHDDALVPKVREHVLDALLQRLPMCVCARGLLHEERRQAIVDPLERDAARLEPPHERAGSGYQYTDRVWRVPARRQPRSEGRNLRVDRSTTAGPRTVWSFEQRLGHWSLLLVGA
jgi:hypothetical protein